MDKWLHLVEQKRFAEAEIIVQAEYEARAHLGDEVENRGWFYEQWGDYAKNRAEKKYLYEKAVRDFQIFASWSTSGGEGTARMRAVYRVEQKLSALNEK
jgi:hypothetical protein